MENKSPLVLEKTNFFEAERIPTVGETIFVGCRRELVVEDLPQNAEHGHIIRTAYKKGGEIVEETYVVKSPQTKYKVVHLGSGTGVGVKDAGYDKKLSEAGF